MCFHEKRNASRTFNDLQRPCVPLVYCIFGNSDFRSLSEKVSTCAFGTFRKKSVQVCSTFGNFRKKSLQARSFPLSKTTQRQLSRRKKGLSKSDWVAKLTCFSNLLRFPGFDFLFVSFRQDRVLIQRVENICYCVTKGEWPHHNQVILGSSPVSASQGASTPSGSRSQTSTPLAFAGSEGRKTPSSATNTPGAMPPPVTAEMFGKLNF